MGNQNQHKSQKRHKELDRLRKAKDKMDRRQGKKDKKAETEADGIPDQLQQIMNSRNINNFSSSLGRRGQQLYPGSDHTIRSINEFRVVSVTPSY
jgi:hypothetical protein